MVTTSTAVSQFFYDLARSASSVEENHFNLDVQCSRGGIYDPIPFHVWQKHELEYIAQGKQLYETSFAWVLSAGLEKGYVEFCAMHPFATNKSKTKQDVVFVTSPIKYSLKAARRYYERSSNTLNFDSEMDFLNQDLFDGLSQIPDGENRIDWIVPHSEGALLGERRASKTKVFRCYRYTRKSGYRHKWNDVSYPFLAHTYVSNDQLLPFQKQALEAFNNKQWDAYRSLIRNNPLPNMSKH